MRTKLSIMMFLEFFIWSSWFVLNFGYAPQVIGEKHVYTEIKLSADSDPIMVIDKPFVINSAFPIASLLAMFGLTALVDRKMSAEKYMFIAHMIGGLAMLGLGFASDYVPPDQMYLVFAALMYIHCIAYVPTISVSNSIAFTHLKNASHDFGRVRLWGTIGWIAASLPFTFLLTDWSKIQGADTFSSGWFKMVFDPANGKTGDAWLHGVKYAYVAAGVASLLLSMISLVLPHTPPKQSSEPQKSAMGEAIGYLAKPFIFVLFVVTFVDAMIHQGYFLVTEGFLKEKVGIPAGFVLPVMSLGQVAEILTMAVLGWFLKSFGWRFTMILGVMGHAIRFGVFAFYPQQVPVIASIMLHGICYAFFFATVYIFIDAYFPTDVRTSAQGLFNFLILGFGPFVANALWPTLVKNTSVNGVVQWDKYFVYPSATALGAAVILLLFFHPPKQTATGNAGALPH
ncbi:MFS transporter [Telmatocola sphagniphila]|uniref:MFS transporter n=1 Tax=Telmatocola sphagniphila TaxID=1123043 RepID=A0A8E6EXZ4_9BACT|nr:MFS transporter [Telmatocola sphagniphila]QVL32153.1 MFS transporter [Telmatocola sphagniphila]